MLSVSCTLMWVVSCSRVKFPVLVVTQRQTMWHNDMCLEKSLGVLDCVGGFLSG